jgi:uncharacterized SAM-binding protein YcdF (DUF218 family)
VKRVATALGATVVVVALSFLALPSFARALIVRAEPAVADAIIVLSGSAVQAERIAWASELFKQGHTSRVLVTNDGVRGGWSRARQARPMMVARARQALVEAGVPADQVIQLPGVVRSTYDEAVALRSFVEREPVPKVVIVTSGYHSRRALWTFRRVMQGSGTTVGINPVTDGSQSPPAATWWTTRRGWRQVGSEYPKLLYYWFKY